MKLLFWLVLYKSEILKLKWWIVLGWNHDNRLYVKRGRCSISWASNLWDKSWYRM